LEAAPDLILENVFDEKRYEQLNKIAPMYTFKDARADWRATIRTLGDLLGKSDKAKEVVQQYDNRAKEAGDKIKQKIGSQTVAIQACP
jgi:iron complex transport system substrate-binding protein